MDYIVKHNGKSAGLVSRHEPTVAYDVCGKDGHKPVLRSPSHKIQSSRRAGLLKAPIVTIWNKSWVSVSTSGNGEPLPSMK